MVKTEEEILNIIKTATAHRAQKDADVINYCNKILSEIPEYENITNVCYSIRKNKPIKVCPVCGKYITYGKTKKKKDKFCSDACYRSPRGLKLAKQKRDATNIEKYGSLENAFQSHHLAWKESMVKKYGKVMHWTPDWQKKREQTMLERYGAKNTLESDFLKEKVKKTNLKRYGVENIGNSKEIRDKIFSTVMERYGCSSTLKDKEVQNKIKSTNLKRYGSELVGKSEIIREKIKKTNLERYGCEYPLQNKNVNKKAVEVKRRELEEHVRRRVYGLGYEIIAEYNGSSCRNYIKCLRCDNTFLHNIMSNKPIHCPFCDKMTGSRIENTLFKYIKSLGVTVRERDRDILNGKELDLVIPSKKVAIEIDGIYWHSEARGKNKNYHIDKTKLCNEVGLNLIHIFDDELLEKNKIVKSRIRAILGYTPYKIQARKCRVEEITNDLYTKFVEKYHIQGAINTSVRLGLFYKQRLVAVMGFNKSRFNKKYDYELMRYCTVFSFNVVGGAGKLLKHFRKKYNGSIISYADKRWSTGNLYKSLGFKELEDTQPNYFYVKGNKRESRQKYQKHKLKNILKNFDESLTEKQNMINNGYSIIWDCGNKVFVLDKND